MGSPGKGWEMARRGLGRVKGRSRWTATAAWCPPSQKTIGDVWTPGLRGVHVVLPCVGDTEAGNRLLPTPQYTRDMGSLDP